MTFKKVWIPHKGSQELAITCPANSVLYHGTRGPGKTDVQIMRFRKRVGLGYGKFWRGVIFDREYKNLDDLVAKTIRWFPEFNDGAKFLSAKADYKWVWPNGEELAFRVVKKERDYWAYHGQEIPFIGWNELTKYPNDKLYESMLSCNRSSFIPEEHPVFIDGEVFDKYGVIVLVSQTNPNARRRLLPDIPLEVFSTTNPFGVGHNWVKKKFIDGQPAGSIKREVINVFNPRTQRKEDVVLTQCHIFGSYRENKNLSPKYIADLVKIKDPNKRMAWLGGSWDITSGGMFDDLWSAYNHIVKPFKIPMGWTITRSFDWGSSKPFSVGWWAIANGEEFIDGDGKVRQSIKGDLYRIGEWYGCEEGERNVGLRLLDKEIAKGIIQRQIKMGIQNLVKPGPADNSIWDDNNANCIAKGMAKKVTIDGKTYNGVEWNRSDKSKGSRKRGWEKLRELLQNAIPDDNGRREAPGLFIFNNCVNTIDLFPSLPRDEEDPDDVDTDSEDHIGDEMRYLALDRAIGIRQAKTTGE